MADKNKYFVGIAGNIGVGKTTMTRIISEKLGWKPFYESVINNPYLDDFYRDMNRWSFNLQVYFLSKRFKTHKEMLEGDLSVVQDRTIYEDVEIFARTIYEQGSMNKRDYENYCDLFSVMTSYLKPPDLIVYLKASTDTLLSRIRGRGRGYERKISPEYLHRLNVSYEKWIKKARKLTNVLTIETDGINIIKDEMEVQNILNSIKKYCP
ncbi:MAG: deoxynucleoside kinase [Fidelibacterota bacterium]